MSDDLYFDKSKNKNTTQTNKQTPTYSQNCFPPENEPRNNRQKPKKKKKHIFAKIIATVLSLLIIFVIVAAAGTVTTILSSYTPAQYNDNAYVSQSDLKDSAAVTNILFIGQDSTAGLDENSRSDTMILVSLNSVDHTIKLTSFMRDLWVNIPGHGGAKLNAACQYGGPQLVCDTIESVFSIDIDGYCRVNFEVFEDIINALDGITVPEISQAESDSLARSRVTVAPGTDVKLNGAQALMYCRIRNGAGDDYGRTERQREMITLIIKKVAVSGPAKMLSIAKIVLTEVEMSLTEKQLISLALSALTCLTSDIQQQQIPAPGTFTDQYMSGQDSLVADFSANTEVLNEFIYADR